MESIDPTDYTDLPYNGLTTSAEIIDDQLKALGISLDALQEPSRAVASSLETSDIPPAERELYTPEVTVSKSSTTSPTSTAQTSTAPTKSTMYSGPTDRGKSFGDVLEYYGLPSSLSKLIRDAEDAFVGIPKDLQENKDVSFYEVIAKNNRLQGLGAILILVAGIGLILNALLEKEG